MKEKPERIQRFKNFNQKLYCKEADRGEINSGELKVDTTGFTPLPILMKRCGLKGFEIPQYNTVDSPVDRYTDSIDIYMTGLQQLEVAEKKAIDSIQKKVDNNNINSNINMSAPLSVEADVNNK